MTYKYADMYYKISHNGGIYDGRKYRYTIDNMTGYIMRIELDILGTMAAYGAWEIYAR